MLYNEVGNIIQIRHDYGDYLLFLDQYLPGGSEQILVSVAAHWAKV